MTAAEDRTTRGPVGSVGYRVTGAGAPLVLVHGTASSSTATWGHLLDRLAPMRRVLTVDLPGSGRSEPATKDLSVEDLAGTVAAVVQAERLDDVRLAGLSLGAVAALAAAAQLGPAVRDLVLIGGWARASPAMRDGFARWARLLATSPSLAAAEIVQDSFSAGWLAALPADHVAALLRGLRRSLATDAAQRAALAQLDLDARLDVRTLTRSIEVPAVVAGMSEDRVVPAVEVRALAALLPAVRYVDLPGGHAVTAEQPDAVVDLLLHGADTTSLVQ